MMKYTWFSLLAGMMLWTGCWQRYDIHLINGGTITHVTKPKLNKETGVYSYKNIKGEMRTITATRVVEIAPHSEVKVKVMAPPPPAK